MKGRKLLQFGLVGAGALAIVASGVWGALFLFYRVPGGEVAAGFGASAFGLLAVWTVIALFRGRYLPAVGHVAVFLTLLAWFFARAPRDDLDWAPDVSRPLRATINGEHVTIPDVRDFTWHGDDDFEPHWLAETYNLAELKTLDLINSYWAGPVIAHTLLSFGFADGRHLVFSVEIRRQRDQVYSNLAGFFREYELVFVGAEERDIVRVRTNIRHEDTQLYRVKASRDQIGSLFVELLGRANRVAEQPTWYNSMTTNCTTEMFAAARTVAPGLPFDWRVILSGFLPDYAYDQGLLDSRVPFTSLRDRSHIAAVAIEAADAPDFSSRIREGVPDPND